MNNAVFVISEFNPFTRGHAHLLAELHRSYDTVICLMSGAFVQRGLPACANKYLRAKAAVLGGADLVFELPFPFSCAAAPDFARAGVRLGASLGASAFGFGAEDGLEKIEKASLAATPEKARAAVENDGRLSYPKAVSAALSAAGLESGLLSRPNNILAAEYLRACRVYAPEASLVCVSRDTSLPSSSDVRAAMNGDWSALVPQSTYRTLRGSLADPDPFWSAAIADLRRGAAAGDVYGGEGGVLERISAAAQTCPDVEALCEKAASATLTKARVRRTLIASYFGVTSARVHAAPSYALLLALGSRGREYLSQHKNDFGIPVITKPADHKAAGPDAAADFEYALAAERVYSLCCKGYNPLAASPFSCI